MRYRSPKERALLVAFFLGAVASFSMGVTHVRYHRAHRAHFEAHLANVCLDAAEGRQFERLHEGRRFRRIERRVTRACAHAAERRRERTESAALVGTDLVETARGEARVSPPRGAPHGW
ncbi:MAG: hypothetical protein AAF411_13220 [Myxococcota bacterium]